MSFSIQLHRNTSAVTVTDQSFIDFDEGENNVDERFKRWWIVPATSDIKKLREQHFADRMPPIIILPDFSGTVQEEKKLKFKDALTGMRKYHQILLERSIHQLYELPELENGQAKVSNKQTDNVFSDTYMHHMCIFSPSLAGNISQSECFADLLQHVNRFINDTSSVVRYVYGYQRETGQPIMVRLDVYRSKRDLTVAGIDPKLMSERSHKRLIRHFHSWTETIVLPDIINDLAEVTVRFVCTAMEASPTNLRTYLKKNTISLHMGITLCADVAEMALFFRKGFYNTQGHLIANEIGPIYNRNMFINTKYMDHPSSKSLLQLANLNFSRRWDIKRNLGTVTLVPSRKDLVHIGTFMFTMLLSSAGVAVDTAETLGCGIAIDVLLEGSLWKLLINKLLIGAEDVCKLLIKMFEYFPSKPRYPEHEFLPEINKCLSMLQDEDKVQLHCVKEHFVEEILNMATKPDNSVSKLIETPSTRGHIRDDEREPTVLLLKIIWNLTQIFILFMKSTTKNMIVRRFLSWLSESSEMTKGIPEKKVDLDKNVCDDLDYLAEFLESMVKNFNTLMEMTAYQETSESTLHKLNRSTSHINQDHPSWDAWSKVIPYFKMAKELIVQGKLELTNYPDIWKERIKDIIKFLDIVTDSLNYTLQMCPESSNGHSRILELESVGQCLFFPHIKDGVATLLDLVAVIESKMLPNGMDVPIDR